MELRFYPVPQTVMARLRNNAGINAIYLRKGPAGGKAAFGIGKHFLHLARVLPKSPD
jgi:hypothetical protein